MGNWIAKTYLLISGLIIILVGAYISLTPNDYLTSMNVPLGLELNGGIDKNLGPSVSFLSDLRAMGGLIFSIGLYVFIATFRKDSIKSAVFISVAFYTVFIVFRTLSFMLDGIPSLEIMVAFLIELILAFFGLLLIFLKRDHYETKKLVNPVLKN